MSNNDARRSNWGRWGADDQRGTLNLLTPERVAAALAVPREGRVFQLGTEISKRGVNNSGRNATWHLTTTVEDPDRPGYGRAEDVVMFHTHAHTHIDGLAHNWFDGQMYNGYPAKKAVGRGGASWGGVENYGGIIGTAIILDVTHDRPPMEPGEVVTVAALEAAAARASIAPEDADIVLIRVGWTELFFSDKKRYESGAPGLGPEASDWIASLDPAVVGMDCSAIEPLPTPEGVYTLAAHKLFLHDLGTPLIESLALAEVAAAGVTDGLFMTSPLLIDRGLGSPLNPLLVV